VSLPSVVAALCLIAVVGAPLAARPRSAGAASPRVEVVAGFYPLAWAAQEIGGRRVEVRNLTPAGTEPHDLELTPDQRDAIEDADLVLVLGEDFQPVVEDAADARDDGTVELLDRLPLEDLRGRADPHVWLDPALMRAIVDQTAAALSRVDRRGASTYTARAAALGARLDALDARFTTGLAQCDRRVLVTTHEAFGYLARAYDLRPEGATGLVPDAEPDPARLAELADLIERTGTTTVFTEELVSPRIARTLAREAGGVRVAVLNPLEGLTDAERRAGDDYIEVMDRNLTRLRRALGCT
jgi:zinc transport system substrate-binding protein